MSRGLSTVHGFPPGPRNGHTHRTVLRAFIREMSPQQDPPLQALRLGVTQSTGLLPPRPRFGENDCPTRRLPRPRLSRGRLLYVKRLTKREPQRRGRWQIILRDPLRDVWPY